jgi:hypothetical protein
MIVSVERTIVVTELRTYYDEEKHIDYDNY